MEIYQKGVILAMLILSVAALVVPAVIWCIRRMSRESSGGRKPKSAVSSILLFSACFITSVWCLRYAVGFFSIISAGDGVITLTWWEEIFNSMIHALQTFSMDEDYTEYIFKGKEMLGVIFGETSPWVSIYGLYAAISNFVAPVAGGAIIFEILASIFPKIKIRLSNFAVWREKYYFSELNDASLALAKSICNLNIRAYKRPVMVFTDAYIDDEDEKDSELLLEAKSLGAICIKDDLSHILKNKHGMRKFFLIDKTDSENLKALANLANSGNNVYLKKAEIYLFTNDDTYVQVEERIRDKLLCECHFAEEELPVIVPVQSYRNLISNLLVDVPLYEPLIGKKKDERGSQTLTVTILGTGHIGTEMFLSTYWLGQILDCNLKINILSQETEEEFWSKIDYINPEIRHTTIEGDPILRINRKGDMAKVYCEVQYLQCDVKSSEFVSYLTEQNRHILDTDYFLVSLGLDEDNISVANTVRKYVGQYHISVNKPVKTVITYVVYDSELSKTLNRKKYFSFLKDGCDVYMQAIGSLHDVYSVRNVFLSEHEPFAEKAHQAYAAIQNREERAKTHKKRMNDDYKHWANLARGMHIKYKVYSMGMMTCSLFDYCDAEEVYKETVKKAYEVYKKVISGEIEFDSVEAENKHLKLLHRMAWLEHRRWNAFTRVKGFRTTTDYNTYATPGDFGSYKQMDIKLHPCLVECDQNGIKARISSKGIIDENTLFQSEAYDDFDLLDDLSYDMYKRKLNNYDFKQYDYPISTL